jgi:predicted phosphatase
MLDEILSEELKNENITSISLDKLSKDIETLKKLRLRYDDTIHKKEIKIYEDIAESIFEVRIEKYIENGLKSSDFDSFIFDLLSKLKDIYISILTGNVILNKDRLMCKVLKQINIKEKVLNPGDIIFLPIKVAISLWIGEYITPYKLVNY